jgi:hypothetical protein
MAQLASLATLLSTGANLYAAGRQTAAQNASFKAAQEQEEARQQQLQLQQEAGARARQDRLEKTIASARARLAAGGVRPDEGSGAALTRGFAEDAREAQAESDAMFASRLAAGRRSLLNPDGSLTSWLRAGSSLGSSVRSMLE